MGRSKNKKRASKDNGGLFRSFLRSVWLYPAILTILLLGLTAFKISGSSIGIYYKVLYGPTSRDPNLLYGDPRPIRSDEWLVNTQLQLGQQANQFKRFNENIGTQKDMSFHLDVPAKDWSAMFKPQNLAYFVLPFQYAFAFKWWLLLYLLIISTYFFTLRFFPGKRLLSGLASTGFAFSPFVFWWYLNGTIAPLFYGFFILVLSMRIINGETLPLMKNRRKLAYGFYAIALAYLLVCFGLILYPPFQIPIAIGIAMFVVGYILQKWLSEKVRFGLLLKRSLLFVVAAVLAGVTLFIFVSTRREVVDAISQTVYPGQRVEKSGTLKPELMLTSYLQPQLQRDSRAAHYYQNQSEASNFILIMPLLLLPGIYLLVRQKIKKKQTDWLLFSLTIGALLFLARIFIPAGDALYSLLFLDSVPNERLIIGVGFIGFIHMVCFMRRNQFELFSLLERRVLLPVYLLLCFGVLFSLGMAVKADYPKFVGNVFLIALGSLYITLIAGSILVKRYLIAMMLFFVISAASIVRVHPLYRGMDILTKSLVGEKMRAVSSEADTWVSVDHIFFENIAIINDRDSLTGIHFYPDLVYWRELAGSQNDYIHNRYAHVEFTAREEMTQPMLLVQPDQFAVKLECSPFIKREVEYVLIHYELNMPCLQLRDTIHYPAATFYIYKIVK